MDRSIEMIIGILAILVSGGIYVPLNPCDSSRRLDSLIQQIKPKLILRDILCSAYQCEQLPEVSITGESKLSSHQDPLVLQKVFRFDIEISSLT
jgi:non-ribosomal peptide synthetase component F